MLTLSPRSISVMERFCTASATAFLMCWRYRRRNRSRFTALLFLPLRRRSTMWVIPIVRLLEVRKGLMRLSDSEVPLRQQPDLFLGVAPVDHPLHKLFVFLLVFLAGLRIEGSHLQQFFGVGEHLFLEHATQLLVAEPGGVIPRIVGPGTQHEVDYLVAEVLRVAD